MGGTTGVLRHHHRFRVDGTWRNFQEQGNWRSEPGGVLDFRSALHGWDFRFKRDGKDCLRDLDGKQDLIRCES